MLEEDLEETIGEDVEVWNDRERLAYGTLVEIEPDYDSINEVQEEYGDSIRVLQILTPVTTIQWATSFMPEHRHIEGTMCAIRNGNTLYVAPSGAIYEVY